ncbi:MAG: helicase-exonuclease AddAB subunit AddA [Oscillospiraceae bacterium]|nr:helicase-exonuclease AddAB subunit AddA [Oscillospiraceae bacterium]
MKKEYTLEQARAINISGGNILVSASAGSGKTAVLVERILKKILDKENNIGIDKLLVLTFSNSSAKEMKERIAKRLKDELENDKGNLYIKNQILLLSRADISTVSSFCLSLVKKNFEKLNIPYNIKIADNLQLENLKLDVLEKVLEINYKNAEEGFLSLVEFFCSKNDKGLEEILIDIFKILEYQPDPKEMLDKFINMYNDQNIEDTIWGRIILEKGLKICEYIIDILEEVLLIIRNDEELNKAYKLSFEDCLNTFIRIKTYISENRWDDIYNIFKIFKFIRLGKLTNYDDVDTKECIKNIKGNIVKYIDKLKEEYFICSQQEFNEDIKKLYPIVNSLCQISYEFYIKYKDLRFEKNLFSYNDLEHLALELLMDKVDKRKKSEFGKEIENKYEEILVDEYQDTNDIQEKIFKMISKNDENIFMVGDAKQSVYRFRQAVPKLFIDKSINYFDYDEKIFPCKINLNNNFRSRKQVTDFTNYIFSRTMNIDMGGIEYNKENELISSFNYDDKEDCKAEFNIIVGDEDSKVKIIEMEANYISNRIKKMIDEGFKVLDGNHMRNCVEEDFCILLRSLKDKGEIYQNSLINHKLSTNIKMKSDNLIYTYEISNIINLLKIINNPVDNIAMLGVLTSPLFNFSKDDLVYLRQNDKNESLYKEILNLAKKEDAKFKNFIDQLDSFREYSNMYSIYRLIYHIYTSLDVYMIFSALEIGKKAINNLDIFLQYSKKYDDIENNLSDFLRFINICYKNQMEFRGEEDRGVGKGVSILTIHSSKGLEFPIVFLADTDKKYNKTDIKKNFMIDKNLGFCMKIIDRENFRLYETIMHSAGKIIESQEMLSEEMRLLYVAMTRSREKLILTMKVNKNIEKKLKQQKNIEKKHISSAGLLSVVQSHGDIVCTGLYKNKNFTKMKMGYNIYPDYISDEDIDIVVGINDTEGYIEEGVIIEDDKIREKSDKNYIKEIEENILWKYPYKDYLSIPVKMSVTDISKVKNRDKISINKRPFFAMESGVTGAEKGTILHTFMQYANFTEAQKDLDKEIENIILKKYITKEQVKTLNKDKIKIFLESNICKRIINSSIVKREIAFRDIIFPSDLNLSNSEQGILIQGIADCLILDKEENIIIDYKTDFVKDKSELIARYTLQMKIYKHAIEDSYKIKVDKVYIYSLHLGEEIEMKM